MKLLRNYSRKGARDRCWFKNYVYFRFDKLTQSTQKVSIETYVEVHNINTVFQVVPKYQLDATKSKIQKIYDTKDSA